MTTSTTSMVTDPTCPESRSELAICHPSFTISRLPNDIFLNTFRVIGNAYDYLTRLGESVNFENISSYSNHQLHEFKELYNKRKTIAKSFISLMLTCNRFYKIVTSDSQFGTLINLCRKSITVVPKSNATITNKKKHQPQCCSIQ